MQKQRILEAEEELEDLRRLFKEQVRIGMSVDPEDDTIDPLTQS